MHFLLALIMVYSLCPFSATFLSHGEVLGCTETQISLLHRRWGSPSVVPKSGFFIRCAGCQSTCWVKIFVFIARLQSRVPGI